MILRRIKAHIEKENWFAVFLDFCIVVVGVFIGIQVNNWNEARQDAQQSQGYIALILDDLQASKSTMEYFYNYSSWVKGHITKTIDALDSYHEEGAELGTSFLVDAYISGHGVGGSIQRETFESLMADGGFGKINNAEVRQRILRYYRYADDAERVFSVRSGYQQVLRQVMPYKMVRILRANCGIEGTVSVVNEYGVEPLSDPDSCPPELPEAEKVRALKRLQSVDLLPVLSEALSVIEVKQPRYKRLILESEELYQWLKEYP